MDLFVTAKPFLKWVGGKTQLLFLINNHIKRCVANSQSKINYIEPFVGGGSVFFHLMSNWRSVIDRCVINDLNKSLSITYTIVRDNLEQLIDRLCNLQEQFNSSKDLEQKEMYYRIRDEYNKSNNLSYLDIASYFIFLNKTCFNGVFRLNSKKEFNVPFSKVDNISLFNKKNIESASNILREIKITNVSYEKTIDYVTENTLVYIDPPYRPTSKTSSFTSYLEKFCDDDQIKVKDFCDEIDRLGAKFILSNSSSDDFFDNLYKKYNIQRVRAKRMINSVGSKRGEVEELIITNF